MDQDYFLPSLEKIFEDADVNKDGFLDVHEVSSHMKKLGHKYPALLEVLEQFLNLKLILTYLLGLYVFNYLLIFQIEKRATELFEKVDVNQDGKLSKEEFREFLMLVDKTTTR
jgi:Ca2+-binding EF-hand superfamily protein